MAGFKLETKCGYDFFEVSSALQKSIRRGLEEDALYWALELEPRYHVYLWKRLTVMVNEEIGIANPLLIPTFEALKSQFFQMKEEKNNRERTLPLANVILLMCRSKKSRIADDFRTVAQRTPRGNKQIPDYALDAHTARGKAMGRGWDKDGDRFWFEVSSIVENEVEGLNIYLEPRKNMPADRFPDQFSVKKDLFSSDNENEGDAE